MSAQPGTRWENLLTILILIGFLTLSGVVCASAENAQVKPEPQTGEAAGQKGEPQHLEPAEYHTPLAGEAGRVPFMGTVVEIPAQDRSTLTALTLGGSILMPKQGDTLGLPIAALYLRRVRDDYRTRDTISIFVNELEYERKLGPGPFEMVGHFDNYTLPFGETVVVDNNEIKPTSTQWGTILGSLGPGLHYKVAPYQVDNDLRLQLWGRVGYLYAQRTDDTGVDQMLPPDTALYGARLRVRYDGMRRNLLELPHLGVAAGADLDFMHRGSWHSLGGAASGAPSYWQAQGYVTGVGGIPGLSEKNRVMFTLHAGTTMDHNGDRYNAFRINGGPFPSETEDLARPNLEGAIFDSVFVTNYATASLIYRRELAFFLYLSLKGSYIYADRASVTGLDQVVFRSTSDTAATIGIDTAFFADSELFLGYSWDSGFIRGGKSGSGVMLTWNKTF